MARMTRAEREAQWEAERLESNKREFADLKLNWTRRVAVAMAKLAANYSQVFVEVSEVGEALSISVTDPDRYSRKVWNFPVELADVEFSDESFKSFDLFNRALEELEYCLRQMDAQRKEEARKSAVRKEALSKLNDEEKELLGL